VLKLLLDIMTMSKEHVNASAHSELLYLSFIVFDSNIQTESYA